MQPNREPKRLTFENAIMTIFSLIVLHASVASSAQVQYTWHQYPTGVACLEIAADGRFTSVSPDLCMSNIGAKVEWRQSAQGVICAEETPDGIYLQNIDAKYCIERLPTHTAWQQDTNGRQICVLETEAGDAVEVKDGSLCEGSQTTPTTQPIQPQPTTAPVTPVTVPQPVTPSTSQQRTRHAPGYSWSDVNQSSCVLYGADGYVERLAPPASCRGH